MKSSKFIFFSLIIISTILTSWSTPKNALSSHNTMTVSYHSNYNSNVLAGTSWRIDDNAFFYEERESYILTPKNLSEKFDFDHFGHFLDFNKEGSFYGYYSAPCGNDCFTTINGTDTIVNEDKVKIFVTLAEQGEYCDTRTTIKNKDMGTFKIEVQPKKALLLKRL